MKGRAMGLRVASAARSVKKWRFSMESSSWTGIVEPSEGKG